ncbi:MAG: hypothetical protein HYZ75_10355 [Elusimicrobia bacterium]|nr:hypothetical protein [Elusimicrobiota bacterium]
MTGTTLVTGAASGLGAYLSAELEGAPWRRGESFPAAAGTIIHCAANARRAAGPAQRAAQREDNVGLTERLLALPHERFVLVSTVEAAAPASDYARDKREAEALAAARGRRPLILRCGALLGPGMRPNSLTRLAEGRPLTLSGDSRFAWVLYSQVRDFLAAALDRGLEGTYNLVPRRTATLAEAAAALGLAPAWGGHLYISPEADGSAARAVCPAFEREALENAVAFVRGTT